MRDTRSGLAAMACSLSASASLSPAGVKTAAPSQSSRKVGISESSSAHPDIAASSTASPNGSYRDGETKMPARSRQAAMEASRSEEHTSELQSLMRNSYAVFCLKKKKNNNT